MISFNLDFTIGLSAFYTESLWGIRIVKDIVIQLLSGAIIPLAFFPNKVQEVLMLLPFQAIYNSPLTIVALCFAWQKLDLPVTFASISLCFVQWLGASLVITGMMILASAAAFWINKSASIMTLIFKLKEYASYPVTIYKGIWRFTLTFIIPLAFIAYYPSHNLLRPEQISILSYFSPVVGIVVFFVGYKVWIKGTKVYGGTGT